MTNHDDAIKIDENERRYFVSRHYEVASEDPEYYRKLFGWVVQKDDDGIYGWKRFARFLMQRDISDFVSIYSQAHAPMTVARRDLVKESRNEVQDLFEELIESCRPPFHRDLVRADHVFDAFPKMCGNYSRKFIATLIKEAVLSIDKQEKADTRDKFETKKSIVMDGRFSEKYGGQLCRGLICLRKHAHWRECDPTQRTVEVFAASGDGEIQSGNPLSEGSI